MSIIKSYSVGNGDMFFIKHNSALMTIIDCFINDKKGDFILNELKTINENNNIFISTHPDEDHIKGIECIECQLGINMFFCVKNQVEKENPSHSFKTYCNFRDDKMRNTIELSHGIMYTTHKNRTAEADDGLYCLWPKVEDENFKEELEKANNGQLDNNISPIILYSTSNDASFIWFGDLEKEFLNKIKQKINLPKVDILFASHHGRNSGKIPVELLNKMSPQLIIIGEAPSEFLNYYQGYNTITQNSAGDIVFDCTSNDTIDIYVSNKNYHRDFLYKKPEITNTEFYLGSLKISQK